jgi:hypothetical protein
MVGGLRLEVGRGGGVDCVGCVMDCSLATSLCLLVLSSGSGEGMVVHEGVNDAPAARLLGCSCLEAACLGSARVQSTWNETLLITFLSKSQYHITALPLEFNDTIITRILLVSSSAHELSPSRTHIEQHPIRSHVDIISECALIAFRGPFSCLHAHSSLRS